MDSTMSPKVKSSEGEGVGVHSLVRSTLKVEGCAGALGWGLRRLTSNSIIHTDLHKPNNKLVSAYLSIFGARMNHEQTQTHKIHHGLDLGETNTFPLLVLYVLSHRASTQMSFSPMTPNLGVSKFPKLGLLRLRSPISLYSYLWLKWGLKQSYSPCRDLSNNMLHPTFTQGNWGDSWLLMLGSQIGNLIPDPSFGHNLCLKCPNGSCEPILNI